MIENLPVTMLMYLIYCLFSFYNHLIQNVINHCGSVSFHLFWVLFSFTKKKKANLFHTYEGK